MSEPEVPEPAPLKCFVIMPFTETTHTKNEEVRITAEQWTHIFNEWIKKAVESFPERKIDCKRSAAAPGNFVKGIIEDLNSHNLVVADLTGNRPNVYYELGIRNALRNGTIMITQTIAAVPSDLRSYYCFQYFYSEKAHEYADAFGRFERDFHDNIRAVLAHDFASDNPVSDFLQQHQPRKNSAAPELLNAIAPLLREGVALQNSLGPLNNANFDIPSTMTKAEEWAERVTLLLKPRLGAMAVFDFEESGWNIASSHPIHGLEVFLFVGKRVTGLKKIVQELKERI